MRPKMNPLYDVSALSENELRAMRDAIDARLEKIEEEQQAHRDELGRQLGSLIAQIQSEGYDVDIMTCNSGWAEEELSIIKNDTVSIRVR